MSKRANRVKWIDNMRGMAIIAVVVCHQMNFLHSSETVQCLTLYSVTSLIFLMGLTKGFSLSRFIKSRNKDETFLQYTIKSLLPVLSAYFVASYIILRKANIGDNQQLMISLLNYSADSPFYYVQHIIRLSVFAPVIFFTISKIFDEQNKLVRIIKLIAFLALLWIVGYFSIGVLDIFSQSYLFVYALGILCSFVSLPKPSLKLLALNLCMLLFGGYAVFSFYFARVAGNYSYNEFIDSKR